MISEEARDLLALHLVPGLGPRLTAALLERFGSATAIRRASAEQLQQVQHIGRHLAHQFAGALRTVDVEAELQRMAQHQVTPRLLGSPEYPAALATIPDPPPVLYVRGTLEPGDVRAVGIVGSRGCTGYGKRVAERLAADLARAGYVIVSGLARGIDGAAHRAALQAGGRTLAVLAGGLSRIYPPEHKDLALQVQAAGALLSEATMDMVSLPTMFPARNRLISGLSQAVVLVEAAERSGALITAEHAATQGRLVFAVPGAVDSEASGGTNELLRQGAILCRSAEDVLEELNGVADRNAPRLQTAAAAVPTAASPLPAPPPLQLDATQQRVWDFLAGEARHFDDMVQSLGVAVPQVLAALLMLEMKKIVRRLPGNRYERC
jgi:DNA processing protein